MNSRRRDFVAALAGAGAGAVLPQAADAAQTQSAGPATVETSNATVTETASGKLRGLCRSGNPNHPGLPHWPAHTRNGATMVFDNVCKVRNGLEAEGLALIARA